MQSTEAISLSNLSGTVLKSTTFFILLVLHKYTQLYVHICRLLYEQNDQWMYQY